jgi:acetyl-CoA acetyltransferase
VSGGIRFEYHFNTNASDEESSSKMTLYRVIGCPNQIIYDAIEEAYCGYIYGDRNCGQRVLYQLGMTQIPIVNVNNNCSTGSTALWMGRNAIRGGGVDCVLCVGWEEMESGISHFRKSANGRTIEE